MASIAQATIAPDKIGLPFSNKTGGTLTAGTLVYVSGQDTVAVLPTVSKASATFATALAQYVVIADVLNNATGRMGKHYSLTNVNTNAATAGDAVYLDTTAGGYTMTTGPATGIAYQRVGRVAVKSATVGQIEFELLSAGEGISFLERPQIFFPTIATTATTESAPIRITRFGTIVGFNLAFNTALPINGTNYVTFTVNNRTQTKLLTSAVVGNSTNTGGQAITQYGGYVLTVTATAADLSVNALDVITCTATVTGTLGGALGPGTFSLLYAPT